MKYQALLTLSFLLFFNQIKAQMDITYQTPPREIVEIADAPLPPSVLIDDDNKNIVLLHQNSYINIADLSESEMRLAGLRINPVKYIDNIIK